jgi:zinc transport system permease protein
MMELLHIPAFGRAIIALFASGLAFPLLGIYIFSLELIPARFGVMHLSLLGATVGLILGVDPVLFAMLFSIAAGFAISGLSMRRSGGPSGGTSGGAMALLMTASLGIVFILFYKTNVHAIEAFNLFWGNVLALDRTEVVLVVIISALILAGTARFLRPISAVLFDRETAFAFGFPSTAVYTAILVVVCAGIGLGMRITGALMVDAVTLLPALAAQSLGLNFKPTMLLASLFGVSINLAGFALAVIFDLPTSPAIIVVGTTCVLACRLAARRNLKDKRGLTPF